ncbi:SGNH/GDSL hydrolase family protein [Rhizobium grahamii]|uniref:Uncharacterized protein n=1 Tax=Rhizobium grahamii CCGE 502 TaxID=990285 RepID=S3HVV3_9HYPH|nr:SGNH/GDSL hydrolase family protein [Rhizobium grahamii]EPE97306.1 hypothetical protein RGCCGE502_14695 [Rhizobium grahamii CCGE 502]
MFLGIDISAHRPAHHDGARPRSIVAFGDSLTAGAGASSSDHSYPALAASLFNPPRTVLNRGIGGQASTQIAVRQGGLPLQLAVQGTETKNLYPRSRDWMTSFDAGFINGLAHELVAAGVDENGLPYGDVRVHGTATASFTDIGRQIYGSIAANLEVEAGSHWTISGEAQLVGGSASGINGFNLLLIQADEAGGYINEIASPGFPLNGARNTISGSGEATHAFIRSTFLLNVVVSSAIDITLRIFPGQFEAGPVRTSLQLTPGDGTINLYDPTFSTTSRFEIGADGWTPRFQDGHTTPLRVENRRLIVQNDDAGILRGCEIALAAVPQGKTIRVGFDLDFIEGGGLVQIGGLNAPGGSWAAETAEGNATSVISHSGHHEVILTSGNSTFGNESCGAIAFVSSDSYVTWSLDNISIEWGDSSPQIPVTYKSADIFIDSGVHRGSASGTLVGIKGSISADAAGNWSFTRRSAGDSAGVPYSATFLLDDAIATRGDVQWIWAGRNNASAPATVMSDIAAMANRVARGRYLVGSILAAASDTPEVMQQISELNAALKTVYQNQFVDLRAALQSAANQTSGDQEDVATGLVPRSLRADAIHLNDQGYAVVAAAWAGATIAQGW